jgi:hypothetical protein
MHHDPHKNAGTHVRCTRKCHGRPGSLGIAVGLRATRWAQGPGINPHQIANRHHKGDQHDEVNPERPARQPRNHLLHEGRPRIAGAFLPACQSKDSGVAPKAGMQSAHLLSSSGLRTANQAPRPIAALITVNTVLLTIASQEEELPLIQTVIATTAIMICAKPHKRAFPLPQTASEQRPTAHSRSWLATHNVR